MRHSWRSLIEVAFSGRQAFEGEAALAAAMEEKVSKDPWTQLLYTGRMESEPEVPLQSGIFPVPVPEARESIRGAA
jgi:hypothetical protein